jgi:hypothetical protein
MAEQVQNGNGQKQLSAQERASLFIKSTRQNYQMLPKQKVTSEDSTIEFTLPKVRLLSKLIIEVEGTATLTSTAGTIARKRFSPYNVLRRVSLDMNNGFSPFVLNGEELFLFDKVSNNSEIYDVSSNPKSNTFVENVASADGTDNRFKFAVELQNTLNDRDPVGLILLQSNTTNVTLSVDIGRMASMYTLNESNGDTVTFKDLAVSVAVETYTIPPIPSAFPDISILKQVQSKRDLFSSGVGTMKLPVGTIYRKMILKFEHEDGTPFTDEDFNGNIELVFNQADIPYSIKPSILSAINHKQFGQVMPDGCYIFDFSHQGLSEYGNSKNYVDTERLSEFWVRFNSEHHSRVTVVSETLSRLRQA